MLTLPYAPPPRPPGGRGNPTSPLPAYPYRLAGTPGREGAGERRVGAPPGTPPLLHFHLTRSHLPGPCRGQGCPATLLPPTLHLPPTPRPTCPRWPPHLQRQHRGASLGSCCTLEEALRHAYPRDQSLGSFKGVAPGAWVLRHMPAASSIGGRQRCKRLPTCGEVPVRGIFLAWGQPEAKVCVRLPPKLPPLEAMPRSGLTCKQATRFYTGHTQSSPATKVLQLLPPQRRCQEVQARGRKVGHVLPTQGQVVPFKERIPTVRKRSTGLQGL